MDFLDKVILDNAIGDYLIVIGVVLFFRLFRKFLSRPFALSLYFFIRRFWNQIEKKAFMEMIALPIGRFITLMAGLTAISSLHYPSAWNIIIQGISLKLFFYKTMQAAFILTLSWFLSKTVNFTALIMGKKAELSPDTRDDQLILFFRDLLKVIIAIATIFIVLRFVFEKNISSLLTGLSIVGAALALAAKETIENLISSFIIFFDEPFSTGDLVKVGGINGTIEHIGLRSTRIRTAEKTLVTVPNKQMVDSQVDNWTRRTERRAEIKMELSPQTSTAKLIALQDKIKAALADQKAVLKSSVFFSEIGKSGKILTIEYFTEPCPIESFSALKEELNLIFSKGIEELNIDMAAGSQVTIISDTGSQQPSSASII